MTRFQIVLISLLLAFTLTNKVFADNHAKMPQSKKNVIKAAEIAPPKELIEQGAVLTLDQCINIAIKMNPGVSAAKSTTDIYQSRIGEVKANYFPQVNVASGYNRENPSGDFHGDYNQYGGTASVSQLLFDFGKTPTQTKVAKLNLSSSRNNLDNTIVQLAFNVKQNYYNVLAAKLSEDIYKKSIKEYEEHLRQAKAFFKIGTISKIDVTTAEVNLSNAQLNYIKAEDQYKTSISLLNNVMGIPNAPEYSIADTLTYKSNVKVGVSNSSTKIINVANKSNNPSLKSSVEETDIVENLAFKKFDITLEDATKKAFDNRPDLKALIATQASAKASVRLAQSNYFPTVSGTASYGWGGTTFPLDNGWAFGANVNIPVFNGLLTQNQVKEAKANLDVQSANLEALKQTVYLNVQQSYISLADAEKSIPLAEIIEKQAKENLQLANGRYKVGLGSSIEVEDAETNYNNAQLSYIQAFYNYNIARINLEKAMGVK